MWPTALEQVHWGWSAPSLALSGKAPPIFSIASSSAVVLMSFNYQQSRITWEERAGLSWPAWPVGMAVGEGLDCSDWCRNTQPKMGITFCIQGILDSTKEGVNWMWACMHSLLSVCDYECDMTPLWWTATWNCGLKSTFFPCVVFTGVFYRNWKGN